MATKKKTTTNGPSTRKNDPCNVNPLSTNVSLGNMHTSTTSKPPRHDKVISPNPVLPYPKEAETVIDATERVPQFNPATLSLDDRATSDVGMVDTYNDTPLKPGDNAYIKGPSKKEYSLAENMIASRGGAEGSYRNPGYEAG